MGRYINVRPTNGAQHGAPLVVDDPDAVRRWPALWEYLTLTKWDDGKARLPSTLGLFLGDTGFVGSLNDRAMGRTLWRSADTLLGVLDALEEAIQEGNPDWRRNRQKK
jgi:hypothetical protein